MRSKEEVIAEIESVLNDFSLSIAWLPDSVEERMEVLGDLPVNAFYYIISLLEEIDEIHHTIDLT